MFEKNLENAQSDLNIEPQNYLLVIYKDEIEMSNILKMLPQFIMWGKLCFLY